ncbi:MAG: MATE family efflux transporter [Planctomycetales bacterium]|nr:MATE family efflux transporter [Planctomycetales bacterium]
MQNPYESPQPLTAESQAAERESWWSRPCGGREVLAIALPLVVSTMFWSIQWFVDRMFLMWHSSAEMTAALPAGMAHWTMICFPAGIASFVNTFVAQYHGAGKPERIGLAVAQGVRLGWICTPLFLLSIPLAPLLFGASADREVAKLESEYFQYLAFGAGAMVLGNALSAFYTGRGMTGVVMKVQVAGTLLNVMLDYILIFGKFGCPEMGIKGAAIATAASNWFNVLAFTILLRCFPERDKFGLNSGNRFDSALFWRLLRFGAPGGLPLLVEGASFTLLTHFVTEIGNAEGSATGLAFNVNSIAFIPIFGVSIATSTLVGQKLGENRPDLAARATWTSLVISLAYTSLFGLAYLAVPDFFLLAHGAFAKEEDFARIRELTVILLRFVTAYCIFDAMQLIFVGALKGAGDTFFILIATTTISLAYVTIGRLGQVYGEWGLFGWWWVLTAWLFTLAAVYLARFLQGSWQTMRVIEHDALP